LSKGGVKSKIRSSASRTRFSSSDRSAISRRSESPAPEIAAHVHRQRHWTDRQVREALETAGLRCLAALGQSEEADRIVFSDTIDEERDYKIIYIAGRLA